MPAYSAGPNWSRSFPNQCTCRTSGCHSNLGQTHTCVLLKPSGAAWHDLGTGRPASGMRAYLEVATQRHSALMAAKKLSVAKRTGKFCTWSDDAATQQLAANRERTVSSSTEPRIVACASL